MMDNNTYSLFCDESCHTWNDGVDKMAIGCVWCPTNKVRIINEQIRDIKKSFGIGTEMKWVKLSEAKKDAYIALVKYFFDCPDLHFRVLVVDNKNAIDHEAFHQTHDEWYYKIYWRMLATIVDPANVHNIYIDIKDTKSKSKVAKLHDVLSNTVFDFSHSCIRKIQTVRSHEIEIMQLTDILMGAMLYHCRGMNRVNAKNEIIELIRKQTGYTLDKSTLYRESKYNIFHMKLQENAYELL